MNVDKKILEEVARFNSMNKYIMEQDAPVVPPAPADPAAALPAETPVPPATPEKIDVAADPEVEKIDAGAEKTDSEGGTEELEITDLVDAQTKLGEKQDNYFDNLFNQLQNLESKLSEMDSIMAKLNSIENKIEKYRVKTPEEKLELRSYDSYPFNQKLSQFFDEKEEEMEKTGKRDYVLTPDDVTDINSSEIKDTFQPKPGNVKDFGY